MRDGCGGESPNCFESGNGQQPLSSEEDDDSGGDYGGDDSQDSDEYGGPDNDEYGDGSLANDEYGGVQDDDFDRPARQRGSDGRRPQGREGLGGGRQRPGSRGRPQRPGSRGRPQRPGSRGRPQRPGFGGRPQGQGRFRRPQRPGLGRRPQGQGGPGRRPPGQGGFGGRPQGQGGFGQRPQGQGGVGGRGQGGFGGRGQRPGVGRRPQGQGRFGGRPQRPGFRSMKVSTGHNNVTISKNVRVKRQSQNSQFCEDGYVIQHFFTLFVRKGPDQIRLIMCKLVIHALIFLVHVFNNVNVQGTAQALGKIVLMEAVEHIGVLPMMIVLIGKDVLEAIVPEGEGQSLQALQDQNLHLFHLFLGLQDVIPLEGHFALQEF